MINCIIQCYRCKVKTSIQIMFFLRFTFTLKLPSVTLSIQWTSFLNSQTRNGKQPRTRQWGYWLPSQEQINCVEMQYFGRKDRWTGKQSFSHSGQLTCCCHYDNIAWKKCMHTEIQHYSPVGGCCDFNQSVSKTVLSPWQLILSHILVCS